MIELLKWLPLSPLLGFAILALAGARLTKPQISWIGVGSVAVSALLAAAVGTEFLRGDMQPYRIVPGYWFNTDHLSVSFGFYLDALSITMLFVVTGVGLLIHLYAAGFMASDPDYARFFAYMNLFVAAMLVLVLADNLPLLYLGWEGVGLGSYLLIGFWYQDPNNGYAARKAFVMTRIGDTALLLGLFLLFSELHTFDIQLLMLRTTGQWTAGSPLPVAAATLLLGGALGKSAQLPLQTWLPDAMAGPTPVSALIHAATMVTAGVYLIARTHALFIMAPPVQSAVAMIGAATILIAGCSALAQTDIKRILAYSTISQIGYMFLALGVGAWSAAVFHLLTHAFFKALLFLAVGAVILGFHHEHNIFKMGGLRKAMPLAFWCFLIGAAALSALPFTSGFYSKHEILLAAYQASPSLWAAGCLGAVLTALYSFRLLFVVFFGAEQVVAETQPGWQMGVSMAVLAALALFGGWLGIPLDSVFPMPFKPEHRHIDWIAVVTVLMPFIGLAAAVQFYLTGTYSTQRFAGKGLLNQLRIFFYNGWGFDLLYRTLLVRPFIAVASANRNDALNRVYTATAQLSRFLHFTVSASQTGRLRWYASTMALGAVLMVAIGWLS